MVVSAKMCPLTRSVWQKWWYMLLLYACLFCTTAYCWDCTGHMLVAEIAFRHLDDESATMASSLATALSASGPFEQSPDFIQMACWADDLKGWRMYAMSGWHYKDEPYNPDNITINDGAPDAMNAMTAIQDMITALRAASRGTTPAYVTQFAFANLVHLVGDAHQPLHAASRFNAAHPSGDRGGNEVMVHAHGKALRLHSLWDAMCYVNEPHTARRPLSADDREAVTVFADYLEDSYKFTPAQRVFTSPHELLRESYEFAVNTSYNGVDDGAVLTDDYLDHCREVAEARVTLAGLRLAQLLNTLLPRFAWTRKDVRLHEDRSTVKRQPEKRTGGHVSRTRRSMSGRCTPRGALRRAHHIS